jgi:argininosuccinate lyase
MEPDTTEPLTPSPRTAHRSRRSLLADGITLGTRKEHTVLQRFMILSSTLVLVSVGPATGQTVDEHDDFYHLGQINKASNVMLSEIDLVPKALAATIARGVEQVILEEAQPDAQRSSNYLVFEARLLEVAGRDASRLHTGRSRQDIGSTLRRLALREALLDTYRRMHASREQLLQLASRHDHTIIPAYTHGVQAQPTSLAHYLLAFASALDRDAERLEQVYARLNRSPLGAAALATSGFALDRHRLAELLGFQGVVENSYDANLVSSVDSKIEFVHALANSAVQVGLFVEDIHTQYHDPVPWILVDPAQTGVSSIMPQKRNPLSLERLRARASEVIGEAQTVLLNAHNTSTGMADYRPATQALETAEKARDMYRRYAQVVGGLAVNPARSLEELDSDYSSMTEVADVLLRHADVPFRVGHHYASELTTYGRRHGKTPKQLTPMELQRIYRESTDGDELPVSVEIIQQALDPEQMVLSRRGLGGPQPPEVARMLVAHRERLATSKAWLATERRRLDEPRSALESAFDQLASDDRRN